MNRFFIAAVAIAAVSTSTASAQPAISRTLGDSLEIMKDMVGDPLKGVPSALIADAQGIAIIPNVVKAGFVLAGRGGHGIVLAKDKEGRWSDPTFIDLGGASVGFQVGVESTDVVLVFRKRKSLDRLLEGKNKVTLGADAAIAAGPLGRQAAAATDGKLEAEILSYSRSRGLFAGVSLDGAIINPSTRTNDAFARGMRPDEAKLVADLKNRLTEMGETKPAATLGAPSLTPVPVPVPVPVPRQ